MKNYIKWILLLIGLIIILSISGVFPVSISYSIKVPAQIVPIREYVLNRTNDGSLLFTQFDYSGNSLQKYQVFEIERGDIGQFYLNPTLSKKTAISEGDTIGQFTSNNTSRELAALQGKLSAEKQSLYVLLSGEKPSLVNELRQKLNFTAKQVEEQRKILERKRDLFRKGLISEQENEISETDYELLQIAEKKAQAELTSVLTGAKESEIKYMQSRIQALEQEIEVLENKRRSMTLIAPFSGKLLQTFSSDTILVVVDTTAYVARMLVKLRDYYYLRPHSPVQFAIPLLSKKIEANLNNFNPVVRVMNGSQFMYVSAIVKSAEMVPGIIAMASVKSIKLTIPAYLKKLFSR